MEGYLRIITSKPMVLTPTRSLLVSLAGGCLLAATGLLAIAATPVELAGAQDHPMIGRYAGSVLQNAASENFSSVVVPSGPGKHSSAGKLAFDKSTVVEGKLSSFFYIAPKGRTALEVFRNYQAALKDAGFATLYSCEMRSCDDAMIREPFPGEVVRPRKWSSLSSNPAGSVDRDVRFVSAKATRNGSDAYVMVFVAEPNSLWGAPATVVLVAEPAAAEMGKVVIASDKLRAALADEGKISLYGIYFDTGRAELKPESGAQLTEMAALLNDQKSLKVLIVGHTDNEGSADANLALSQRRAEAVVVSLAASYHVESTRMRARGVANFAPVATNRTDAGRAKNRRVELVEQ